MRHEVGMPCATLVFRTTCFRNAGADCGTANRYSTQQSEQFAAFDRLVFQQESRQAIELGSPFGERRTDTLFCFAEQPPDFLIDRLSGTFAVLAAPLDLRLRRQKHL